VLLNLYLPSEGVRFCSYNLSKPYLYFGNKYNSKMLNSTFSGFKSNFSNNITKKSLESLESGRGDTFTKRLFL
jgi:hypothetical protein